MGLLSSFIGEKPRVKQSSVDSGTELEEDDSNKYTFMQACALNTMMMFGTGPFITIPLCLAATDPPGPTALFGYSLAGAACFADSFIWGELGSRFPRSGGTYVYLRECYGVGTYGDLMAFIYLWQSWISGPAEVASGFIAISEYLAYIHGRQDYWTRSLIAASLNVLSTCMLMRRTGNTGLVVYVLWAITIMSILYVVIAGLAHFDVDNLALPPKVLDTSWASLVLGFGAAARFGIYDFTGYYDVCTMGGEVRNPRRTIPASCIVTCAVLLVVYMLTYVAVIGFLPWDGPDGFVTRVLAGDEGSNYIMAEFSERLVGRPFAAFTAVVVSLVIFGAVFSMMAGMMYLPGAAAESGLFAETFARRSTLAFSRDVPIVSLVALGACSTVWCFFSLHTVVGAMTVMLVLVQFLGQAVGLLLLRRRIRLGKQAEDLKAWKIKSLPVVLIPQLLIFTFIFITTDNYLVSGRDPLLELALLYIVVGALVFLARQRWTRGWPFAAPCHQAGEDAIDVGSVPKDAIDVGSVPKGTPIGTALVLPECSPMAAAGIGAGSRILLRSQTTVTDASGASTAVIISTTFANLPPSLPAGLEPTASPESRPAKAMPTLDAATKSAHAEEAVPIGSAYAEEEAILSSPQRKPASVTAKSTPWHAHWGERLRSRTQDDPPPHQHTSDVETYLAMSAI